MAAGATQATVGWIAPLDAGGAPLTGFDVQVAPAADPTAWMDAGSVTGAGVDLVVSGLVKGESYVFRVRAVNAGGPGPWSAASGPVLVPVTVPGAPTGLSAQVGNAEVALSWAAPTDEGGAAVTSYAVRVFDANSETPLATQSTPDAGTTFTVTGLTNGLAYQFDVAAINAQGTGAPSVKTAPVCGSGQWLGAYFVGTGLSGVPVVRCDTAVNFDWGTASPIPGSMPVDNFSVRWATTRVFTAGDYQFTATADDGVRVKVDNGPWIIDAWKDQGPTTYQAAIPLTAGEHTSPSSTTRRAAGPWPTSTGSPWRAPPANGPVRTSTTGT